VQPVKAEKRSFCDVINDQKKVGEWNELRVLYGIAKFGWLSVSQSAKFSGVSIGTMGHILQRLFEKRCIQFQAFPDSQNVKAVALTRAGKNRIERIEFEGMPPVKNATVFYASRVTKKPQFLETHEHLYHRHLTNEFLMDVITGSIVVHDNEIETFITEHDIGKLENTIMRVMQCVPDAIALTTDRKLIVIETENTGRGKKNHGSKLTHWLEVFAQRYEDEGCYSASLWDLFPELITYDEAEDRMTFPDFEDVEQVFVCSNEKNFRNIYYHVQRATSEYTSVRDNITYYVIYTDSEKKWDNIFEEVMHDSYDVLVHSEPETAERVAEGSRTFRYSDEYMMSVLNEVKNNPQISISQIAESHRVNRSTLTRWNHNFNYIYKR
jgi:DNA-binding MarR family transcriptional regulator